MRAHLNSTATCFACGHGWYIHADEDGENAECLAFVTDNDLTNERPDGYCGCPAFVRGQWCQDNACTDFEAHAGGHWHEVRS
jgi:hypothetical protein